MSQAQVNPSEVPSGPKKKRHRWLLRLFFTILSVAVLSFLIDKERLQWRLRKAILEMDDRGFTTELSVFATNPVD